MTRISITVDGVHYTDDVEPRTLLVSYLREDLGKVGTVVGCDTSNCGACTVHLDGDSVKSCSVLAVQADGGTVTTIEGLAATYGDGSGTAAPGSNGAAGSDGAAGSRGPALHPMQQAFHEHHALQCGFCTPGMVMAACDLVRHTPDPSAEEVREGIEGNLCRCTGYQNIVHAVQAGAAAMLGADGTSSADGTGSADGTSSTAGTGSAATSTMVHAVQEGVANAHPAEPQPTATAGDAQ